MLPEKLGKVPPRDTELEEIVLGALMLEKDAYMNVCDILVPESFYDPVNQMIYEAIQDLGLSQRPIDMMTVVDRLRQKGTIEQVGGAVHIMELTGRLYSAANIEYHAHIINQKYLARRLIRFAVEVEEQAYDEGQDVADLLQNAESGLFDISQTQLKREVTQIDPVINQALEEIQAAQNSDSGISGLPTGYDDLDRMTSGWQNSDLIIIAGRPAMGKTALVLTMAKNMAIDFAIPVAIFSLEMPNVQLVKRLISNIAEIDASKLKSGRLTEEEQSRLNKKIISAYSAPLYLDETPSLSITEMRTKARRLVREKGVKIIMIDYLQLMTAGSSKFGSREQEVSTISRSLKALAKELNVPIIALSQLNRGNESREDKRPVLSDLRESGAIEQDADIVCFVHRPEYYTKAAVDADNNDIRGLAELIVAKHRNGSVGDVKLRFTGRFARFENWDAGYRAAQESLEYVSSNSRLNGQTDAEAGAPSEGPKFGVGSLPTSDLPEIMRDPGETDIPF
ncbi:MAG: replicative DNA helicase [Muribaculaceae bacterium]|nr:replicative DNA helicase [Muribaculaceae bacterium]